MTRSLELALVVVLLVIVAMVLMLLLGSQTLAGVLGGFGVRSVALRLVQVIRPLRVVRAMKPFLRLPAKAVQRMP